MNKYLVFAGLMLGSSIGVAADTCVPGFSPPCSANAPSHVYRTNLNTINCIFPAYSIDFTISAAVPMKMFPGLSNVEICQKLFDFTDKEFILD